FLLRQKIQKKEYYGVLVCDLEYDLGAILTKSGYKLLKERCQSVYDEKNIVFWKCDSRVGICTDLCVSG
ncbi:MAG: hypothetical protein QOK69_00940, partial [Nitrososphaeraceae archaeon]|nr:hypothetical protein [Nitrososphaeraceae archaeon]